MGYRKSSSGMNRRLMFIASEKPFKLSDSSNMCFRLSNENKTTFQRCRPTTHLPNNLLIHSITHSLTHSVTHSPTYPPTHSFIHSLNHSPTHPHTRPPTLTHSLSHSLSHSVTHSLTHSITQPPNHSTTQSLTHSLPQAWTSHELGFRPFRIAPLQPLLIA